MILLGENKKVRDVSFTEPDRDDGLKLYEFDLSIKLFNGVWTDNIVRVWANNEEDAMKDLWKRTLPNSITVEFNRKKNIYDKVRNFFLGSVSYVENKTYKQDITNINNKITPLMIQRASDLWKWIKKNW